MLVDVFTLIHSSGPTVVRTRLGEAMSNPSISVDREADTVGNVGSAVFGFCGLRLARAVQMGESDNGYE